MSFAPKKLLLLFGRLASHKGVFCRTFCVIMSSDSRRKFIRRITRFTAIWNPNYKWPSGNGAELSCAQESHTDFLKTVGAMPHFWIEHLSKNNAFLWWNQKKTIFELMLRDASAYFSLLSRFVSHTHICIHSIHITFTNLLVQDPFSRFPGNQKFCLKLYIWYNVESWEGKSTCISEYKLKCFHRVL